MRRTEFRTSDRAWRCGRVAEWQSGGVVWQSGGVAEWQSGGGDVCTARLAVTGLSSCIWSVPDGA